MGRMVNDMWWFIISKQVSALITTIPLEIWNRSADLADKPPYKLRYTGQRWLISFPIYPPRFKSSLRYVRINPFIEFYPMEHAYPARRRERINIHPLLFSFSSINFPLSSFRERARCSLWEGRWITETRSKFPEHR